MNLQTYIEDGDIMLRWEFVAGSINYEIYESIDDNTSYVLKDTVGAAVHTYNIGAPVGDHIYFYRVKALVGGETSNEDFIISSSLTFREEMKAIIYNLLKWDADLVAIVGSNIYNKFPQQIEAYPCVIFSLDGANMNVGYSWNEIHSLHVRVYSRDKGEVSDINHLINNLLINFSYQGKEAVIYRIKRVSDNGETLDGDQKTFVIDNIFLMNIERTEVS